MESSTAADVYERVRNLILEADEETLDKIILAIYKILDTCGVSCYEKDGTAYLDLEAVAFGDWFRPQVGERRFYPRKHLLPPRHESQERNRREVSGACCR